MRLPVKPLVPLLLLALISGCGPADGVANSPPPPAEPSGPASDYPVVTGAPFTIDGVTYKPEDRLGYDQVGFASVWLDGANGISAAHKTMPLPSYAEVTALDTGHTILVRVERRGPMVNDRLIELSPNAAMQLGLTGDARAAVRVRRVNPPETERAALRAGNPVPPRMDTPKTLLAVLARKLDAQGEATGAAPAAEPVATPSAPPEPTPRGRKPAARGAAKPSTPAPVVATQAAAPQTRVPARPGRSEGPLVVQVATFASRANADRAAAALGGRVETTGSLFRVRLGGYADRGAAAAALAKVKTAGYSDARILRAH